LSTYCGFQSQTSGSTALDTHIQNDPGHAIHTASIKRGALFRLSVTDATGEFNDAMMHLNTDRAGRKGFIVRVSLLRKPLCGLRTEDL
jgi:hypothetical protein